MLLQQVTASCSERKVIYYRDYDELVVCALTLVGFSPIVDSLLDESH